MEGYPLTLTQLTGALALTLSGVSLPEQGVALPGELRMATTYYPGVSTPSVQIIGTQEGAMTLKGVWRDDTLGLIGGALALVQAARALLLDQRVCLLTWGPNLVRQCLVKRFTPTIRREAVIEWEIELFVMQANESAVIAVPAPAPASTFSLAALIATIQQTLDLAYTTTVTVNNVARAVL